MDTDLRCFAGSGLTSLPGPLLLGYDSTPQAAPSRPPAKELPAHHDEGQVKLDVDRSFIYYPTSTIRLLADMVS